MANLPLDELRDQFQRDGDLIDLYVDSASTEGWQAVIDLIRSTWEYSYQEDGATVEMPGAASDVFAKASDVSVTFGFELLDDLWVSAYFFAPEWFELTLDPAEIQSQGALDAIVGLMVQVAGLLNQPAMLTLESDPELAFLVYDPTDATLFTPAPPVSDDEKPEPAPLDD